MSVVALIEFAAVMNCDDREVVVRSAFGHWYDKTGEEVNDEDFVKSVSNA